MSNIIIDIQSSINRDDIANQLDAWAKLTLNKISIKKSYIEAMIVNRAEGEYYNMVFRKKPGATNVLSFPDDNNGGLIIMCDPVIDEESQYLQKQLDERYFQVFTHGILHLCGYTHDLDDDAKIMEHIEDKLFEIFKKNKS
ncbi:MAG: rRNA maturation RNase YbeY [Gammaproteobacteria bacterium]|nr:rRNA maturation RNase YbeY [Gammaproteobacteria bacterium]